MRVSLSKILTFGSQLFKFELVLRCFDDVLCLAHAWTLKRLISFCWYFAYTCILVMIALSLHWIAIKNSETWKASIVLSNKGLSGWLCSGVFLLNVFHVLFYLLEFSSQSLFSSLNFHFVNLYIELWYNFIFNSLLKNIEKGKVWFSIEFVFDFLNDVLNHVVILINIFLQVLMLISYIQF